MSTLRSRRVLRPSTWGVRVRSTVAAVAVVALAFAVASAALLLILKRSLETSADAVLNGRSREIVEQLRAVPPRELDPALLVTGGQTSVIQVVDERGRVVVSSAGAPSDPLRAGDLGPQPFRFEVERLLGDYRAVARSVDTASGRLSVIVASDEGSIIATLATVGALLAAGIPVVIVVVGAATYALVGRALRPVERMRAAVSDISAADLSERLTVPPTRDDVAALAVTLNEMLVRIEAGQAAQQRFVGDASHELRSPLATLSAALELGAERPALLDRDLVTNQLLPEARRMRHLVEDLLLLARADERGLPLRMADVDLDDILGAELTRLRTTTDLRVVATISATRVRGDALGLTRLVRNLVDNAARYAHSTITLACTADATTATVRIADDGPGIEAQDRARVLERFVRLDSGRDRASGGSGLGLAIVAEIAAAHAGRVAVGASPTGGTEVVVALPVRGPAHPPVSDNR